MMILPISDLQVTLMLLPNFMSIGFSVQEEKRKLDFQVEHHGCHLEFPIGTILAILIYKSPQSFLLSFMSIELLVQKKKGKIDFQAFLAFFSIYKTPQCFQLSFNSIGLSVQEKKRKIDFQDGPYLKFTKTTNSSLRK